MVCHGYGGGKVKSGKADPKVIMEIARRIKLNLAQYGVVAAHAIQPYEGTLVNYDILFEFEPPGYPDKPHAIPRDYYEQLRTAVKGIKVKDPGIEEVEHSILSVDLWVILESFPQSSV